MPSEHRLHPATILFALVGQIREFAVPLAVLLVAGSSRGGFQAWALLFLIPYGIVALARYATFRYAFDDTEMVIRSGVFFRNERHIPYARIQNLDATQSIFHRALGVVKARVDTGSGNDAEASLSVITRRAYEDMRERVFAERQAMSTTAAASGTAEAGPATEPHREVGRTLLRLPSRELVILGLIENRGLIVIAGAFGLLSQSGIDDRIFQRISEDAEGSQSLIRSWLAQLSDLAMRSDGILAGIVIVVAVLVLVRLLSVVLALVRLHGFTLTRIGEDLRAEFGLFTRVTSTVPLRRVQTLTVSAGLLHRAFGRTSVRVDTAGGDGAQVRQRREALAPIITTGAWPGLAREILPEVRMDAVAWRAAAPGAVARELRQRLALSGVASALAAPLAGWYAVAIFVALAMLSWTSARRYVEGLGWGTVDGAVLYRSGWIGRHMTVARFTRIQTVSMHETPFDRRRQMARVHVDTAGASGSAHRVHIPYLTRHDAEALHALLAAEASRTTFHW
jgi:putative membrane protein